jgi:imidazolonepropionase-like amidohydrolase
MSTLVLVCGNVFDGLSDALTGPAEILIEGNRITKIERSVGRPPGARVIDLSERTVTPGFIDTHVHLTMDAALDLFAGSGTGTIAAMRWGMESIAVEREPKYGDMIRRRVVDELHRR